MMGITVSTFEWIALALLALCAWIFPRLGDSLFERCEKIFGRLAHRKQLAILVAAIAPLLLRLALLPVLPIPAPAIHDEFSYLLAADTFAHGRLTDPPHPLWMSFETFHVNMRPTYGSKYPPAQGMVLAVGQLLGHPWLGVLLSVGAMCAAICWMLQAWFPPEWALLGSLLAAIRFGSFSYWINSYWGGAVAGIGGALALGALPLIRRTQRVRYAVILGIGVAILANSRPFEGLIFSIPIFLWLMLWLFRKDEVSLQTKIRKTVLPLTVVLTLAVGWIGFYNWRVTGKPSLFPYVLYQRTYETQPLFVWQSAQPMYTYNNAQFNLFYNIWARSQYHRSWADIERVTLSKFDSFWATFLGPVCVLPAFMLPWVLQDRRSRLFVVIFVVSWVGLLSVVWWMGHYAAPITGLTFALIVQSMRHLRQLRFETRPVGLAWLRVSVLMLFVAFGASLVRQIQHPYSWMFGFGPGNLQRASILKSLQSQPGKQLVMVRYGHPHYVHDEWVYNDADIDSAKVVWARELNNDQDAKLISYFSDRHLWLVEPDKVPVELKPYTSPTLITSTKTQ
jgi:hypothetical protein